MSHLPICETPNVDDEDNAMHGETQFHEGGVGNITSSLM